MSVISNIKTWMSSYKNTRRLIEGEKISDFDDVFNYGAVMFSGGVESTYLLILHAMRSDDPVAISCIHNNTTERLSDIIKLISDRLTKPISSIFLEPDSGININDIPDYAVNKLGKYGCMGGGNPPPIHLTHYKGAPIRYHSDCMKIGNLYRPLHNVTKDKVIYLANKIGMIDIITKTRSCVSLSSERCGTCWFCMERKWAFDVNNIKDKEY